MLEVLDSAMPSSPGSTEMGMYSWTSCPFGCQRSRYQVGKRTGASRSSGTNRLAQWSVLLCCVGWIFLLHISSVQAIKNEKVCPSLDIRNKVSGFQALRNCTVIEGSLQILLIDYAKASDFQQLSFPDLVEVTEYLLLYRVYGLKTLSHIFPNLSVIRGQTLFFNYALVAFEMPNMEEIGLPGLSRIVRGAVRIEKNPHLCYIDTIDWAQITTVKREDNFIIENKDIDECANVCPRDPNTREASCPSMSVELSTGDHKNQQLCWTAQHCQKVCPSACGIRSCYTEQNDRGRNVQTCCHHECVGGCTGRKNTDCIACAHIFYAGHCVQRCPPNTFEYRRRRCITESQCRNISMNGQNGPPWKIFRNESKCVEECPSGYIESRNDPHVCVQCVGPCPKVCNGLMVDSVAAAQQIKGCTVINGLLDIQIRGGSHIGAELEENLGSIKEIMHYLTIVRSYALLSMHFLKNLQTIHGQQLHNDRHALVVIDNQNLRDIWDFKTHPNLTILNGLVFFHYNRRLCLHLIDQLIILSGINGTDNKDVSRETNGDLVPCQTQELDLEVISHHPTHAIIRWSNFFLNDHRELLGWVINLREAPFRNVTMYDSRDACGTDEWKQEDVQPDTDLEAHWIAHILYQLKPFTQYAVYVQTFTLAQAEKGAMSGIVYFTTDPDVPWPAQDIRVYAENQGELLVRWKPPWKPNGNVTHYYVYWYPQILDRHKLDQRNYCEDKLRLPGNKKETVIDKGDDQNATAPSGECCTCPKSEEEQILEEEERQMQIKFEDYLHDTVYIKRPVPNAGAPSPGPSPGSQVHGSPLAPPTSDEKSSKRRRREIGGKNPSGPFGKNSSYNHVFNNLSQANITDHDVLDNEPESYEAAIVYGKTEVILPNLKHFQEYNIEVIACHDYVEGQKFKRCSNRAITTHRTLASEIADTLNLENISSINGSVPGEVLLRWSDPPSPNGLIVMYEIELSRTDTPNYKPYSFCITHKTFSELGGYRLENNAPGNWSYKIRATSLAGNGSYTPAMYFYVPDLDAGSNINIGLIAGLSAFAAILIIVLVATSIWLVAKKRFNRHVPDNILYASVNPEYWSAADVYIPDDWEVSRDKIQLLRELGQGSFGMVYEGIATDIVANEPVSKVAIKTVNENATMRDRIEFLNEASVMKVFDCNHVVKLRGVVSKGQPTLVVMELMAMGDLKSFLRSHRPDENDLKPPTLKEIIQTAGEVADGMAYLAAKKFVHRDLAARNCMVSENKVVKIGDFGMTREIYETDYYRKGGKGLLPVRWMAPESLQDGLFTSQSDVWSYGVVLWEMATLAAQPYQGLANEQVLHFVIDRGIMEKPEGCPDRLYEIMQLCWKHNPKDRPTFCEIIEDLMPDLNPSFHDVSYFFSAERKATLDAAAAAEAGPTEGDEEEDDDQDDSQSPLTGSPLHENTDINNHGRMSDMGDEEENDDQDYHKQETSSLDSTLSYESSQNKLTPKHNHNNAYIVMPDNNQTSHGLPSNKQEANHLCWDDRNSHSPPPAPGSNEGSKGSSKSTHSSHSGINGFVNGQVPRYITPPQC